MLWVCPGLYRVVHVVARLTCPCLPVCLAVCQSAYVYRSLQVLRPWVIPRNPGQHSPDCLSAALGAALRHGILHFYFDWRILCPPCVHPLFA